MSFIGVAYRNRSEASYQELHPWRKWSSLSQQELTIYRPSRKGGASRVSPPSTHCRESQLLLSSRVQPLYSAWKPDTALCPTLHLFYSFFLLFHSAPWASEEMKSMTLWRLSIQKKTAFEHTWTSCQSLDKTHPTPYPHLTYKSLFRSLRHTNNSREHAFQSGGVGKYKNEHFSGG